jgi:hypothetical protein
MVDEALALLAQNPAADFTFTTRAAHEVKAAPFDVQSDLASVGHELAGAAITVLIPNGDGRWRLLQRADGDGFSSYRQARRPRAGVPTVSGRCRDDRSAFVH